MAITQKSLYAVRATFELAKHEGEGPVKMDAIAEAQAIPKRFLEVILFELRQKGFVRSSRGKRGGHELARPADQISVAEVLNAMQEKIALLNCLTETETPTCPFIGTCAFSEMWQRAHRAVQEIYEGTSFRDLVDSARTTGFDSCVCQDVPESAHLE